MSDAEDLQINWGPDAPRPEAEPLLHVYTDLDGRINAAADRQYFADYDAIDVGVAADQGLLVFDPDGDRRPLSLSRAGEYGGDIATATRVRQLVDGDDLAETIKVPIEERGDLLVADVGAVLADDEEQRDKEIAQQNTVTVDGSSNTDAEIDIAGDDLMADTHSSQPLVEYYLVDALARGEREFTSREIAAALDADVGSRQVGFALSRLMDAHESPLDVRKTDKLSDDGATIWRVEPSVALAAKLEADDGVDLESVLGEDVGSVQALAEVLDVEEGEARRRAMDAGVYTDLEDHVDRPGVER